jgi:hypothetical protein
LNEALITHGSWNSRLTMPTWLRLVPLVQTTAASSWYRGARKAAPASRNEGDDGAGIEKGEVVVGGVEVAQRALHGRVVGHLLRPAHTTCMCVGS